MHIQSLVIEVTRKCNLSCAHCLRGDSQNVVISNEWIDILLSQVESIGAVTFTGGEPSLAVERIEYFLNKCKELGISIESFYIATNGVAISEEFVIVCLRLYSYCGEKEMCSVDISNDYYHSIEESYDTELLDGLSFVKRKFEKEGYDYQNGKSLINEGYAQQNGIGARNLLSGGIATTDDFNDNEVYLNCKGNIIAGCDWSYESQDNEDNILCTVNDLTAFYEKLEEIEYNRLEEVFNEC